MTHFIKVKSLLLALIYVFISSQLAYGENKLDLRLNDQSLKAEISMHLNQAYDMSSYSDYYWDISYLNKQTQNKQYHFFSTGLRANSPYADEEVFGFFLGIKSIYHSLSHESEDEKINFVAAPLGFGLSFNLNEDIAISSEAYYATKVLTFAQDGSSYFDATLKLQYKVLETSFVYIGTHYKKMTFFEYEDVELEMPFFAGFKIAF